MSNTIDPKLLGELAIVVIRAVGVETPFLQRTLIVYWGIRQQHLSDRSKIGKHHPYVVLKYGSNSSKTPVVKKYALMDSPNA